MRALVGDVLGHCRLVDLWNDRIIAQTGGNKEGEHDRAWGCDALCSYSDYTRTCGIHSSGYASFFTVSHGDVSRNSVLQLGPPAPVKAIDFDGDHFTACFDGRCVTFKENGKLNSFDTITGCSCASVYAGHAAYGMVEGRTVVYDVAAGASTWTAAEPPLDELKLPLCDKDRSLAWAEEQILLVGQSEGNVIVYDTRAGNEAVIRSHIFEEFPVVAMTRIGDLRFAFAETTGSLTIFDLNMPSKRLDGHKGLGGCPSGTVQIVKHPELPMLAVLSCDRVVRMYDLEKPVTAAIKSAFVKVMGASIVLTNDGVPEEDDPSDEEWAQLPEDGDSLWDDFVACPQAKKK